MEENYSGQNRWPKIILFLILILAVAAVAIVSIVRERIVSPSQWQVSVTGQGKVSYQPDIANITLGVQIDKVARAEDALNLLNERVNKIIAAVKALEIPAADIQTQNYSLYPQYDAVDNISTLTGYNANQQLLIKVRGIDKESGKVSKVIAEATKVGANQVIGIGFEAANIEDLKQEARVKAINDAKSKANKLADAAGVELGKIIGWWENFIQVPSSGQYSYDGKGGAGGAGMPAVPSGGQEVIIEVNLNYRVK